MVNIATESKFPIKDGCIKMDNLVKIVILVSVVTSVSCNECVDSRCFNTNTSDTRDGVVVKHGCAHTGSRLYQCSLSIMVTSDSIKNQQGCVALGKVPGIPQFCEAYNTESRGQPAPPMIFDDGNEDITTGSPNDEAVDLRNEYITCIGTEVLVGVAVGSFVLGCFVTWAFITILTQCKSLQKELRDVQESNPGRSSGRSRAQCEINSSSAHQRLLSNASAESFPSSSLCSPQSNGQARRQSEDTRHDEGSSGRIFQMRQPLPAPPLPDVALQPYYAQPIDSLYTCTSDRDYQSIQGGSEHYAPVSEGGDYTSLKSHGKIRVVVGADDNLKKQGENLGGNDYCSLESDRGNPNETVIYYPASDSSNKDYISLVDDTDGGNYCGLNHRDQPVYDGNIPTRSNSSDKDNVKFQVNGFDGFCVPKQVGLLAKPGHWSLGNIAEAQFDTTRSNDPDLSKSVSMTGRHEKDGIDAAGTATRPIFDQSSSGSLNTSAYAGVDFHDYEVCNGSVHEYYVLEEASTSV